MDPNIKNAKVVSMEEGAQILADALVSGSGGIVVLWSETATFDLGSISAQGRGVSGSGGDVEISSHRYLHFDGDVNVSAQSGMDGEVFFDPFSITIQSASPDINGNGSGLDITSITQLDDATTTPTGFPNASSIITAGALSSLLTNNVSMTLAAQSFITLNAALSPAGTNVTLTLEAPTINLNNTITLASGGTLVGVGVNTINVGASGSPQNAVDLSVNGTTINLSSATYLGPISIINKNITLNGNGSANTTILNPPGGVPSHSGRNPVIFVQGGTNTVIQNLTVDGNYVGFPTNANITGIFYLNAGGTVSNSHVTHIANSAPPYGGGQQGNAIRAVVSAGGPFSFNVDSTTIDFFQKAGIVVSGSPLTVNLTNNNIIGLGTTSTPAAIGIQVSSGTTGSVTGNTISGIQFTDHAQADGILLFEAGSNFLVSGNTITGNDEGILSLDTGDGLVIQNNIITNSGDSGIAVLDTLGDTQITSNTLTNNGGLAGAGNANTGIYLFSSTNETFEVTQNTITPASGTSALFAQGNAAGQAPDIALLSNTFVDP
jgi:parallel beta-helix repeat protein